MHHHAVAAELDHLGRLGLLATCVTVDLEVLYSARKPAEFHDIDRARRAGFIDLPMVPEIANRARAIRAALAKRSQHRGAGVVDLLTAATAERYGALVLHYDHDFDHIAAVTGQAVRWVVEPGSDS